MRFNYFGASALLVASLAMSGCTAVLSDVTETWKYATERSPDAELSASEIQQFPYTAIYARRGDQPRALIVLGFVDGRGSNARLQWVSSQREVLETNNGRIVRTHKFAPDLLAVTNLENDPLRCFRTEVRETGFLENTQRCATSWSYFIDVAREHEYSRSTMGMHSQFEIEGIERLELPSGKAENTLKISEKVKAESVKGRKNYSFENLYWIGSDGLVLKSQQSYIPGESMIELNVVKWVGRNEVK